MILDAYKERKAAGDLPQGRITGTIQGYDIGDDQPGATGPYHDRDYVTVLVTASDVDGVVPGQRVDVLMSEPRDANYLVRDLENGFSTGGLAPVPEGSEVTFPIVSHIQLASK